MSLITVYSKCANSVELPIYNTVSFTANNGDKKTESNKLKSVVILGVNAYKKEKFKNIFVNCALVADDSVTSVKGNFEKGSLMASIDGIRQEDSQVIEVSATTLSSIVKKHNIQKIDFMSLDVEGYELEVLKGIDLNSSWAPNIFLIEIYNDKLKDIVEFLKTNYNFICNFTNYNKKDNPGWDGTHNDYLFIKK